MRIGYIRVSTAEQNTPSKKLTKIEICFTKILDKNKKLIYNEPMITKEVIFMAKLPGNEEVKMQMQNLGFYLPYIRNGFNWNLDDVGERLGVSKQTVLNIEKQARKTVEDSVDNEKIIIEKDCMTYAQYVTLRLIIEDEIASIKDTNEELAKKITFILNVLVDEKLDNLEESPIKDKLKKQDMRAFMRGVLTTVNLVDLFGLFRFWGIMTPWTFIGIGAKAVANVFAWMKPWKVFEKDKDKEA